MMMMIIIIIIIIAEAHHWSLPQGASVKQSTAGSFLYHPNRTSDVTLTRVCQSHALL